MKYILAYSKPWYGDIVKRLEQKINNKFFIIDNKDDFTFKRVSEINPDYIFFPHWSYIIPDRIFKKYKCIIFHMTDLPYGRGGSPLQNLIVRGKKHTVISAILCVEKLDAGPILLKSPLDLKGSARDIFERAKYIIENMIVEILLNNPKPYPQKGKATYFKRRKINQSNIGHLKALNQIYDYIRMLDADGYPSAFIKMGNIKFEFSDADFLNNEIIAKVKISEEKE